MMERLEDRTKDIRTCTTVEFLYVYIILYVVQPETLSWIKQHLPSPLPQLFLLCQEPAQPPLAKKVRSVQYSILLWCQVRQQTKGESASIELVRAKEVGKGDAEEW